jgi:hypothetical protein
MRGLYNKILDFGVLPDPSPLNATAMVKGFGQVPEVPAEVSDLGELTTRRLP